MNEKLARKILVDVVIFVLFLLELNLGITGLFFHELLGLFAGAGIIIHLLLNKQWIKNIAKVFDNKQIKMKLSVELNVCLFITTTVMLVSGIIISRELFDFNVYNYTITAMHKLFCYVTGMIIILHILMHFDYLKGVVKRVLKNENITVYKKGLMVLLIAYLTVFSLYTIIDKVLADYNDSNQYVEEDEEKQQDNQEDENDAEKKDDEKEEESVVKEEEKELPPTLNEFLSKLTCNGCGKHCSLLSPRCGKGMQKQTAATEQYYQTYGE